MSNLVDTCEKQLQSSPEQQLIAAFKEFWDDYRYGTNLSRARQFYVEQKVLHAFEVYDEAVHTGHPVKC